MKSDDTICARELRAVAGALRSWLDVDALADRVGLAAPLEEISDEDARDAHVYIQYTLGVTFARFKELASGPFAFERVELALPEPPDTSRHRDFFSCPIRYGAGTTRLLFRREVWELGLERHDSGLASLLERHARERLSSLEEARDPMTPVRVAVREQLPDGPVKLDAVAKAVAMSSRTLQRRLREAGTSFQELVDEERRSAARAYLSDRRLAVTEIAYLLGYSEASAFVRAFKRWTGMTPKQFRAVAA